MFKKNITFGEKRSNYVARGFMCVYLLELARGGRAASTNQLSQQSNRVHCIAIK